MTGSKPLSSCAKMEDPSAYYHQSSTTHEGQYTSDEVNHSNKTYVDLEVIPRHPNPYDPAAIQLAHQSDLLFNYDSSSNHQEHHIHHHHHHQMVTGLTHTSLQFHELEPFPNRTNHSQSHHHLINLDCPSKSFESIKSVLLLNTDDTDSRIKAEPHLEITTSISGGGSSGGGGPLPFWKERALQIERGTDICMHPNSGIDPVQGKETWMEDCAEHSSGGNKFNYFQIIKSRRATGNEPECAT